MSFERRGSAEDAAAMVPRMTADPARVVVDCT